MSHRRHSLAIAAASAALALTVLSPSAALAGGGGTGADVQLSGSASTGSPNPGAPFSYTFQVKDSGPDTANGIVFSDALPAGMTLNYAAVNGFTAPCGAAGGVVTCNLGTLPGGSQATVTVNVNAPTTSGTYANTGSVASTTPDPQPANNAVTVSVQVKTVTCSLPAGQTTLSGLVMWKGTNSSGLFEDFGFSAGGVNYTVLTNFYDGTRPLTTVINLSCKQSPDSFIQVGKFVNVTGAVDGTTLTIDASVVQVLTFADKI